MRIEKERKSPRKTDVPKLYAYNECEHCVINLLSQPGPWFGSGHTQTWLSGEQNALPGQSGSWRHCFTATHSPDVVGSATVPDGQPHL